MSARAVLRAASGRGKGRRVQTLVIFVVLMLTTAAASVSLALLAVDSSGPFERAFTAQHGADVVAGVNPARATAAQLAATSRLPEVTAAAGPFPVTSATLDSGGTRFATVTVAGRASPTGAVDSLTLLAGRWARRPGEIVIASDLGRGPNTEIGLPVGSPLTEPGGRGGPGGRVLTVVGIAQSITDSAGAWVVPAEIPALRLPGTPAAEQILYRFRQDASAAQIQADVRAVTAALPAGTIAGTTSWLTVSSAAAGASSIIAPFVLAFAIMGLAMSVLIVGCVVSGLVVAGYRRMGVLKSIGLTPAQVIGAYLARVCGPALAGCVLGAAVGRVLAAPVLRRSATVYGVGSQSVPLWVDVVTPLGMCVLTGVTALLPALRASRLSAIQAIATGQAPRQGRGYRAQRLLGRMRLPRTVTLGLAAPFSRPARASVTLAAIASGATAVIFAVSLDASIGRAAVATANAHGPGQLQVSTANGNPLQAGQERKVLAALAAQPGTAHYVAEATPTIGVSGLTRQVNAEAFRGDATWTGYAMVSGHWYSGQGEADVNTAFLSQTGLSVGDLVPVSAGGRQVTVRIVGEVFDPDRHPVLITSWQVLGGLTVDQYAVGLRPGTSLDAYVSSLGNALGGGFSVSTTGGGKFFAVATSLIAMLTLMIAVVAGLGVLNTVLLGTRERMHDLGVFKALGMTPWQMIGLIVCWVAGPALAAAIAAGPAAALLHSVTLRAMANAAGTAIPDAFVRVLGPAEYGGLALSALVIAVAGALLPGSWAARSRTAAALRAE